MKGEYRELSTKTSNEIIQEFKQDEAEAEYIEYDDFMNTINDMENEVNDIIDLIKDEYDLKEALHRLEQLSEKLY